MKKIIEIKEEVQVGNIILEKGDKIEVLEESTPPVIYTAVLLESAYEIEPSGHREVAGETETSLQAEQLKDLVISIRERN